MSDKGHSPIFQVGTLRYDQRGLFILFFWLMWNDFSLMLIEGVGGVGQFLMRDQGATFTQMALIGSFGFWIPWLNPLISTWSDRHRGRLGRRRPFLFFAAPFFALFLACYPYMPTFYHYLLRYPWFVTFAHHFPMKGEIIFLGVCGLITGFFNSLILAIFQYLYWDVVPESHLGRFQSLSANASILAGLVVSFFLFRMADHHMKAVYVVTASFCLIVYVVSVWQIKEGEYPPPDKHKKGGVLAPIRAYVVECFSESYYLWIFAGSLLSQFGNLGGGYQNMFLHYDLHLDIGSLGWAQGWGRVATVAFGMVCGFAIGSMTDRLKPVRLMGPCLIVQGLILFGSFLLVDGRWSYLISVGLLSTVQFATGVVFGAFQVEVFPREKLGQFCSAQAVFYQFPVNFSAPFIGMFFDHIHNNRVGFLWQGSFYVLAAIVYFKVLLNWNVRHGRTPVPCAG